MYDARSNVSHGYLKSDHAAERLPSQEQCDELSEKDSAYKAKREKQEAGVASMSDVVALAGDLMRESKSLNLSRRVRRDAFRMITEMTDTATKVRCLFLLRHLRSVACVVLVSLCLCRNNLKIGLVATF